MGSELRNSMSDLHDLVLNVTEISAETMEKTHAATSSSAEKSVSNMSISVLKFLAFVIIVIFLLTLFAVIPFFCYLKYSSEGNRQRRSTPRINMASLPPIMYTDDWYERRRRQEEQQRRNMPEFGVIFDF
ncbi:unnamed protein product [Caenorhabditis nigoni]